MWRCDLAEAEDRIGLFEAGEVTAFETTAWVLGACVEVLLDHPEEREAVVDLVGRLPAPLLVGLARRLDEKRAGGWLWPPVGAIGSIDLRDDTPSETACREPRAATRTVYGPASKAQASAYERLDHVVRARLGFAVA